MLTEYFYWNAHYLTGAFCLGFMYATEAREAGYLHPYQELTSV